MVHQYLVVGKTVYFNLGRPEGDLDNLYIIELRMPVRHYWEAKELLRQADIIIASQGHMTDVHELYRLVFRKVRNYAVLEKDRLWLIDRSRTVEEQRRFPKTNA